ncbi:MAG: hypothetical protein C0402_04580 [Thermodesulfovibrio sp.]|nr:hypothetical protein [Thermodesulfovibrio sp.]
MRTRLWNGKTVKRGLRYLLCVLAFIMATDGIMLLRKSAADPAPLIIKAGNCMGCHAVKDSTKLFTNKETMSVFIDQKDFQKTVHASLQCTDCHRRVFLDNHPGRDIESKKNFIEESAAACRNCHRDEQLKKKTAHASIIEKPGAPLCTDCHGSHRVLRVAEWKLSLPGKEYCMTCHRQTMDTTLRSGEKLSLRIDPANLASSVHNKHDCSDCHTEYTREAHPVKTFASGREHSIAVAGVCRKCHEGKAAQLRGSTHYNLSFQVGETLVTKGNVKAPVCTDCHGFHAVGPKTTYEILSGVPCRKCHEDIFRVYAKSVHGKAKEKGEHRAPLCASCHFAHEINFTAMTDKIKGACLGCHKGIESVHQKWLPNAELHLNAISCAACHVPASEKGISLQLVDQETGKPVTREQILRLLGNTGEELTELLDAHGEGLNSFELSYLVRRLNAKGAGAKVAYIGKMDIMKYSDAHQLSLKTNAVKECESCHSKDSKFLKKVTLAVLKTDGGSDRYSAQPGALSSIFTMFSSKQFYLVGGTRFEFLDWAGLLVVLGGILLPVLHITARVLTAPLRKQQGKAKGPSEGGSK